MDLLSPTIVEEPILVNPMLVLCSLGTGLLSICCVTDIAFLWPIKTAVYHYVTERPVVIIAIILLINKYLIFKVYCYRLELLLRRIYNILTHHGTFRRSPTQPSQNARKNHIQDPNLQNTKYGE